MASKGKFVSRRDATWTNVPVTIMLDVALFYHPPRMSDRDVAGCGNVNYSKVAQIVFVTRGCVLDDPRSRLGARKTRDPCRM